MKFEIDPNELTTDQRTHVAAFITGWPTSSKVRGFDDTIAAVKYDPVSNVATPITNEEFYITEEQRLDAEQKSDLRDISGIKEIRECGKIAGDDLNAIFGTPDIAKGTPPLIQTTITVPLDKEGLPWDSRIHSSSKATIADGSWKLRRGVDSTEVEKVKAQLKELMAVPVVREVPHGSTGYVHLDPNTVVTIGSAAHVPADDVVHNTGHVDYDPSSKMPQLPIVPAPALTPTSVGYVPVPPAPKSHYLIDQDPTVAANQQPVTLTDLIGRMSKAIAENRLTQANVTEICIKHGVSEFHLLSNRPDLLPLIDADMKVMGV